MCCPEIPSQSNYAIAFFFLTFLFGGLAVMSVILYVRKWYAYLCTRYFTMSCICLVTFLAVALVFFLVIAYIYNADWNDYRRGVSD